MQALILGVVAAVMAMLAAIIRIGIAKAYADGSAHAKRDIENGCGANRRISKPSQCAQYSHDSEIYHNPSHNVKQHKLGPSIFLHLSKIVWRNRICFTPISNSIG